MSAAIRVPSLSTPGVTHEVVRSLERYRCDCTRASFLKAGQECRHMEIARRADALLQKCAQAHGLTLAAGEPTLCRHCVVALLALVAGKVKREYVTRDEAKAKVAAAKRPKVYKCRSCAETFKRPKLRTIHEQETHA